MLSPLAISWYQIMLSPIFSCIRFQLWFYFTWPYLNYTKGVSAWFIIINCSQAIHYNNYIRINVLLYEYLFTLSTIKTFVLLIFGTSPYCWKLFDSKNFLKYRRIYAICRLCWNKLYYDSLNYLRTPIMRAFCK